MSHRPVVLALHYQNDVLHPSGRIRLGLAEHDARRAALLDAANCMLCGARERAWPIIHVRIAFREDYADCLRSIPIFQRTAQLEAVRDGHWGAEFMSGLQPMKSPLEFIVTHTRISGFAGTPLMQLLTHLRATRLLIAGVATHSVVESTVREAADRGFEPWVAADACAAADPGSHEHSLRSMALVATITDVRNALDTLEAAA